MSEHGAGVYEQDGAETGEVLGQVSRLHLEESPESSVHIASLVIVVDGCCSSGGEGEKSLLVAMRRMSYLRSLRLQPTEVGVERTEDKGGGSLFISLLSTFCFLQNIFILLNNLNIFIIFKLYLIDLQKNNLQNTGNGRHYL